MDIEHVPLLQIARDLHDIHRGMKRFRAYLETVLLEDQSDVDLAPLLLMNPLGREHVAARLDELLALDAEQIIADAVSEAAQRLVHVPFSLRLGAVVADDVRGGWTNRYLLQAGGVFMDRKAMMKRPWAGVVLWASQPATAETIRADTLASLYRVAHVLHFGTPRTVNEALKQEGRGAAFAGHGPTLEPDDLAYTREVLSPYLDSDNFATAVACLYGDDIARAVGYAPIGLSPNAGLALAYDDARHEGIAPEAWFV